MDESFSTFSDCLLKKNAVFDLNILAAVFKELVRCNNWDSGIGLKVAPNHGLALNLNLKCFECDYSTEFYSSAFYEDSKTALINTRFFVYAMRCIGKGAEAGRMLCGVLNLPPPPTRFSSYSTDEKPQHGFCPSGDKSWCGYNKSQELGED